MAYSLDEPEKEVARPQHSPPYGMEPYDLPGVYDELGALSDSQQEQLNKYKSKLRQDNEIYLRNHPEIACMIEDFSKKMQTHGSKDARKFAIDYFTSTNLPKLVEQLVMDHKTDRKLNNVLRNTFH